MCDAIFGSFKGLSQARVVHLRIYAFCFATNMATWRDQLDPKYLLPRVDTSFASFCFLVIGSRPVSPIMAEELCLASAVAGAQCPFEEFNQDMENAPGMVPEV